VVGWLGGVVGASYVTSVFLLIPEIGAATIALTVAGQQLAGVAVDHFGLLRLPRRPVGRARLLGSRFCWPASCCCNCEAGARRDRVHGLPP
jgi:uncharacterized membrane protein YdcZ (DUF606 family)